MALVVADRVQETTTTTGTGTYTLAGAKDGFQSFGAVGNSNTTYYACTDGTDYEVGIGTYTASGTTLARTTIIESSNSDAAVNWGAGEKDIFVTLPASKATVLDASGNATFSGDVTFTGASYNALWDASINTLRINTNAQFWLGSGGSVSTRFYHDGSNSYENNYTGSVFITNYANDQDIVIATDDSSGGTANYFVADGSTGEVQLYHYGSQKLATKSTGIDVTGNATFADNGKAIFGAGSDLQIFHDGTHTYIDEINPTGYLFIRGANTQLLNPSNEIYLECNNDGSVDLYHDNSKKLATTSTGISVTGNVAVSGTVDGRDVATDGTKLDGIAAGANVGPSLAVAIALG